MSKKKKSRRDNRQPHDPIHGPLPKFRPGHPLWEDIQDRLGTGVYNYPQVAAHATNMGFPLTAFQIERGLKRYKPAHLPMRVFPWLADMVQHVLDNFIDWDAQLDAAITQQVQFVGMAMEQMRGLREDIQFINAPDGTPLKTTDAHGREQFVFLPAATLDDKIHVLNAAQSAVGKLFRMLVERTRLHAEMRPQVPGKVGEMGEQTAPPGVTTLYNIANINLIRKEMDEVEREMRETYNILIKEAAEVGATLPEPKPIGPRLDEEYD